MTVNTPGKTLTLKQVGGIDPSTNHAQQDIDGAIAVGFDAFALNVGQPDQSWTSDALKLLFDYAADKEFGLFFSFDFFSQPDINLHKTLYDQFKDEPAYYKYGTDQKNFLSTFSGANLGPDTWASFRADNNLFLVPNVEADGNYYSNPSGFFDSWGGALDGVFSWETAWPGQSDTPSNVTSDRDEAVKTAADTAFKAYMMGKDTWISLNIPLVRPY